ncbi:MAG: ABC transporter permease [Mycoplasma sp.]|nr:ABC transporter permease [Candidatus Hennigella equi]
MAIFSNKSVTQQKMNNKWQKFVHSDVRQSTTKKILATIASIFVAFVLALIIACSVCNAWGKIGKVLSIIFTSSFKNQTIVNTLLSNMCILIVGGMAFIFAYKAGLFNIGISGQMVAGGTAATIICHLAKLQPGVNQFVIIIASMAFGALVASLVGVMKAYLRINEVVSSIMFNWIIYFMSILTLSLLPIQRDASNLNTLAPNDNLLLRADGFSWMPLVIITAIVIVFVAVVLNYTVLGRKQRVTGLSNTGALAAGYNVKANMITSMAISGAISGILGVMLYCGFSPNMPVTAAAKAIPQEGFNGISVGLISMCNPVASIPVSLFFSMVKTSVSDLQAIGIDNHIADVIFGIVVYGAAAITLFLNLKPYWLTLRIFRGKNYSKIQHERNMTNIQLLSLASDQCAILSKYYVYYRKQEAVASTMKLNFIIRFKMKFADLRYAIVSLRAKYRVWKNLEFDELTGQKFYKQQMIRVYKKNNLLYVASDKRKAFCKYIKVTDEIIADSQFKNNLKKAFNVNLAPNFMPTLQDVWNKKKAVPWTDNKIKLVAYLAYLQNLRSGLIYRNTISKQNKLTYFALQQTKQQAESIGLAEIRSKKQYLFARTAYFKAYQKTFDIVKAHYDTMARTFGRNKPLNIIGIRFNPETLEQLYINNLKSEIKAIGHLINCPLTKVQLSEVGTLVSRARYLQLRIETGTTQANSFRRMSLPYYDKAKKLNERAARLHSQLKSNIKLVNRLVETPLKDIEADAINNLLGRVDSLNKEIQQVRVQADDAKATAESYVIKSKDVADSVTTDRIAQDQANKKISSIVDRARMTQQTTQQDKWSAQLKANEEAEKILRKLAIKQARRASRRGGE